MVNPFQFLPPPKKPIVKGPVGKKIVTKAAPKKAAPKKKVVSEPIPISKTGSVSIAGPPGPPLPVIEQVKDIPRPRTITTGTQLDPKSFTTQLSKEIVYAKSLRQDVGTTTDIIRGQVTGIDSSQKYIITTGSGKEVVVPGIYAQIRTKGQLFQVGQESKRISRHIRGLEESRTEVRGAKPGTFYVKTDVGYDVGFDPKIWEASETARASREKDYGYFLKKAFSRVFSPERIDMVVSEFTTPVTAGGRARIVDGQLISESAFQKEQERFLARGHYEYTSAWEQGDIGKIAFRAIQSPMVLPIATSAVFKGGSLLLRGVATGFRTAVVKTPIVFTKVSSKFPTVFSTTRLESGTFLRTPASSFTSQLGRTSFYQNIQGWASGSLTRVRTLPMFGRPVTHDIGGGFTQTTTKFKGFGAVSWEPKIAAFQTPVGKTGFAEVQFIDSTIGKGLRSVSRFKYVSKPSGRLWWKKVTAITTSRTKFISSPFTSPPTTGATNLWSGFVKPYATRISTAAEKAIGKPYGKSPYTFIAVRTKPSILFNTEATASLTRHVTHVPVHGGRMVTRGFLMGSVVGSPYTITTPIISSIPSSASFFGTVAGIGTVSLLSYRQRQEQLLGIKPIQIPGYDISSMSAQQLSQQYQQLNVTDQIQSSFQSQKQFQQLQQSQMQKQLTAQSLALKTTTKLKGVPLHIPRPTTITFKSKVPIRIPFLLDSSGKDKRFRRKELDPLGKGFRIREWKVPRLKDFIGGI